jgi:hypothetical protein
MERRRRSGTLHGMGRNNQQRRAAKKRKKQRRARPGSHGASRPSGPGGANGSGRANGGRREAGGHRARSGAPGDAAAGSWSTGAPPLEDLVRAAAAAWGVDATRHE